MQCRQGTATSIELCAALLPLLMNPHAQHMLKI